jgi:MFS family permease
VLGERDFRLYFIALVTSVFGTAMVPVALTFAVLSQGGSASEVGYVLAAGTAPLVVFLLIGGVVNDRYGRRQVMIASDLRRAVAQGVLAYLLLRGRPSFTEFVVLGATVGVGTAFFSPGMTGLVRDVTSLERSQQANSLRGIANSIGRLVGPATAGVIVATAGAGWAIGVDAATYFVSAFCLVRLDSRSARKTAGERFLAELTEGWKEFHSRTWLWAGVAQFALYLPLVSSPFLVFGAVIAKRHFGRASA